MADNIKHFGVSLKNKYDGMELTIDNFIPEAHVKKLPIANVGRFYENYRINIKYFSSLKHETFDSKLKSFNNKYKFNEVIDLNDLNRKSGYYIMVLDKYCQAYIGTSNNIKRRIMQHWNSAGPKGYLYSDIYHTILSIQSFRALDTTRIFFKESNSTYNAEKKYIDNFPSDFLLNRTKGGLLEYGLLEALSNSIERDMTKFRSIKISVVKDKEIKIRIYKRKGKPDINLSKRRKNYDYF